MILQGKKKSILKELIRYYVETTGNTYESFIQSIQSTRCVVTPDMPYADWLAIESFKILTQNEVTLADCIENKDVVRAAIKEDASRMDGEFFTPPEWAIEGRNYLKELLGDLYGEAYIWEASCGTGNLIRDWNYPQDKIFMSTLLKEDIDMIRPSFPNIPEENMFQLDFLSEIDFDDVNTFFTDKLPPKLQQVLHENKPIVFFMNPPYKTMPASSTDVGAYMSGVGLTKSAIDIFNHFLYRIIMLKRVHKLDNVFMGIYGPITVFHSHMLAGLFNEIKEEFVFVDGMGFKAGDFSNTSESVDWFISYTTWRTRRKGEEDRKVILDFKEINLDGEISTVGRRQIKNVDVNLDNWIKAKDITRYDMLPVATSGVRLQGSYDKHPVNALGSIMSSNFVIRATRRCCILSLPSPQGIEITPENFWRVVASYGCRRSYATNSTAFNNCQYYSRPDIAIEGYEQWCIDSLALFLFDFNSQMAAYRGLDTGSEVIDVANKLFPIAYDKLKELITDEVILADMEKHQPENQFILDVIESVKARFGPEAKELYLYGMEMLGTSLLDGSRKAHNYANWSMAWDTGLAQLRAIPGYFSDEASEKYLYLIKQLKSVLEPGIYKYGFIMDSFNTDDSEDSVDGVTETDDLDVEVC